MEDTPGSSICGSWMKNTEINQMPWKYHSFIYSLWWYSWQDTASPRKEISLLPMFISSTWNQEKFPVLISFSRPSHHRDKRHGMLGRFTTLLTHPIGAPGNGGWSEARWPRAAGYESHRRHLYSQRIRAVITSGKLYRWADMDQFLAEVEASVK